MPDFLTLGPPIRGRSCGGCKACCTQVPVAELGKAANSRCKHLVSKGCSIYARRPISCRSWSCRWLFDPDTADLRRPDQSGYILDSALDFVLVDGREVEVLQLWVDPNRRDAHRDPALRSYLAMMGEKFGLPTMVRYSSTDGFFLAPPCMVEERVWVEQVSDMVTCDAMVEKLTAARAAVHD